MDILESAMNTKEYVVYDAAIVPVMKWSINPSLTCCWTVGYTGLYTLAQICHKNATALCNIIYIFIYIIILL